MTDFDQMTDEEIEAYLAEKEQPQERQAARGAREFAIVMIIAGVLGLVASVELLLSELALRADPAASLYCDVNALLACSTFLTSWEGSLLGFPNSYVGIAGFAALIGLGIYLLIKKSLPRVMWIIVGIAAVVSFMALLWFQYTSFIVARTICPWCLVIWSALIPFITQSAGQVHANLSGKESAIWRYRWAIIAVWYAIVIVFALVYFWDLLSSIYGW
ncbi:MAG: vitamin K epoxide reductase family protein [Flaviflexus sp.]|uniref:vitamin K epoxide reductase family protein n=1 Tax=Flaviflexus sp. TaxID=1969482 RepID=UPI00352FEC40